MKTARQPNAAPRSPRKSPDPTPLELADALTNLGDGILITGLEWDHGGVPIFFANAAFCAMTGYAPGELVGRNSSLLNGPRSDTTGLLHWLREAHPGQVHHGEGYLCRKDKSEIFAAWSYSLLGAGRPKSMVAVYRDMTETRRLRDALVHSQRLDAVGRLAGGVAHDFNNLLSVINGYCEILGGRPAIDPAARRELEEIQKAGQKATALTRQLLAFSRRQEMVPSIISLNRMLREMDPLLQRLVGSTNALKLELAPGLGNVRVDPAQIHQVILNLVINGRDALPPAGGTITLRTAAAVVPPPARSHSASVLPPGRYVTIAVSDTGVGMDAETQRHLFEPFFTTKTSGKGAGLGLATAYGIVKQSGGYIAVESSPGVGATFSIYLPEVRESAQTVEMDLRPSPDTRGRETLLVVEEDSLVAKMIAGILAADGYEVLAADRPEDALAVAGRHGRPIDLLIADLADASGRGLKLARALHALKPGFRILNTSNVGDPKTVSWLPAAHQAHLTKPFALSALLRKTREVLDAKEI